MKLGHPSRELLGWRQAAKAISSCDINQDGSLTELSKVAYPMLLK
jgi:hypothetical protein